MFNGIKLFHMKTQTNIKSKKISNFNFFGNQDYLTIYSINFLDISYVGKTYKWNLKQFFWKLTFNRAHPTKIFFKKPLWFKKLAKTKIRVFLPTTTLNNLLYQKMLKTRRYNIFTQRGIKIKGGFVLKKRGKISTYRICLIFGLSYYYFYQRYQLFFVFLLKHLTTFFCCPSLIEFAL